MTATEQGASSSALTPGFANNVADSQDVFRGVLDAMSRPGTLQKVTAGIGAPDGLDIASAAILLTLADHETPLYLAPSLAGEAAATWLKFHCGAPLTRDPREATFAVLDSVPESPDTFNNGTDASPEDGATLLIQTAGITAGSGPLRLSGPGIRDSHRIDLPDIAGSFWEGRAAQQRHFPRGIDLVFVSGAEMLALPRTTTVSIAPEKGADACM